MTKAKRWSYSAGTRGKNRVRAYEEPSGLILVEYWEREDGTGELRRRRHSLGHRDRNRAVREVERIATRLAAHPAKATGEITLGSLFDIYLAEVTPRKGLEKQAHDRRAALMFLDLYGRDRQATALSLRDWDHFIDLRRSGHFGPSEKLQPVGNRQIEYDLKWLRSVYRWGTQAGVDGRPLLERNPLDGYPLPRERSPARPVMREEQYRALLTVAGRVNWRLELALVLAHETGHRLGAIRHLRWSDVDLELRTICWQSRHDKIGFEHETPVSDTLHSALQAAQRRTRAIGDTWVLPAVRHPQRPCPKGTLDKWFSEAVSRAGIELQRGMRWHSLRRKFATELKDMALRDLCYLGGWKDAKTLLTCYQQPDDVAIREGLRNRRTFGSRSLSIQPVSIDSTAERTG